MTKLKRNYYNATEFNNIMVMIAVEQMLEGIRGLGGTTGIPMADAFYERGIITKEQRKNLKMVHTYLRKFTQEAYSNGDMKTKDKIDKKKYNFDFRLIDDFTVKKLYALTSSMDSFRLDEREFKTLVSSIVENKCKNCTSDRNCCPVHSVFVKYMVPPQIKRADVDLPNCEFAFMRETDIDKSIKID